MYCRSIKHSDIPLPSAFIPLQILFSERLTQAVVFRETARDRDKLKEMGITHILNAAAPKKNLKFLLGMAREKDLLGTVNTGSRYYRGLHITYCGLPSSYRHCFDISKYFMPAARFIDKALRNPMSKVLIHCTQGLSHSATLFLAYLMICHDMMVEEAFDRVIKIRQTRRVCAHQRPSGVALTRVHPPLQVT
uniref:Uncharacterized protein n=1 Tax=Cyprinus carpio TaxID=7962 RepID=A0A8C2EES1_CYPCA